MQMEIEKKTKNMRNRKMQELWGTIERLKL
jgi:hypothetical protein